MKHKWMLMGIMLLGVMVMAGCSGNRKKEEKEEEPENVDLFKEFEEEEEEASAKVGILFPAFQCKDQFGGEVSNAIFEDYELTLVNVWGTWCPSCVAELPDLAEVYQELEKEGINIVGIIQDGNTEIETADELLEESGVTYTNIIPDQEFYQEFIAGIMSYPTSYLVNKEGQIIGSPIMGVRSKEQYIELLRDTLDKLT